MKTALHTDLLAEVEAGNVSRTVRGPLARNLVTKQLQEPSHA